ncbi:MAG: gamma-glutamyltransferase [Novosphingobium sp.]|nr:gamma-glutamyltransferase [Novosphingobium sp.]
MLTTQLLRRFTACLFTPLLLAGCATAPASPPKATTAVAHAAPGIVSAADPRAAEAGITMLRQGGSATDAAIATMVALNVVEPQSSGLGGGGFFVRGTSQGDVVTIDGRETAPAVASPRWFLKDDKPLPFADAVMSGLSVGVPGNLRLAADAHQKYGKLPWADLFAPAIALARDGFRISQRLHATLDKNRSRAARNSDGRAIYYDAAGEPLPVGTLVTNPALADFLEDIAEKGADAFYTGAAAATLADKVASDTPRGHAMSVTDVEGYQAKERPPVCGTYRAWRICGMGPPSSGATTVFATLKQLERFDLSAMGSTSPVAWHLIAESQRLAYADRARYLADPDFVPVPVKGLTDPAYLAKRSALISPVDTMQSVEAGTPPEISRNDLPGLGTGPEENGTSHFVAIDSAGNAVSYTSTIEGPFGSGLVWNGLFLNNELTDFSFTPDDNGRPVANRVDGGKRPRSSMSPTVAYAPDGRLTIAVGAAGGTTIPAQVVRALIGMIDWKLPPNQALALPVIFAPGDTIYIEKGSALEAMIPSLKELGHVEIVAYDLPLKTNAAMWDGTRWIGGADPRSEGVSIGE